MSVPSEAYTIQLVQIQSGERLATTSELNSAPDGVICHREARGMGYRATTQAKGLSPEIPVISEVGIPFSNGMMKADAVHLAVGSSLITVMRGYKTPTGSETVARYQKDSIGTWESHNVLEKVWVAAMAVAYKPEEGKAIQMALWQSDKPIVALKSRNGDRAKGLTGRGPPLKTKVRDYGLKVFQHIEGEEAFLKSRVWEIYKHGSVRGFIVDSKRRWL